MIACVIRYEIDPLAGEAFENYAGAWNSILPRCGAHMIGYFAPHEGSATTAYGLYPIESLAAYEACRVRLRTDAEGQANFAFARREGLIRREDRIFLRRL